jgi:hypothetical protein
MAIDRPESWELLWPDSRRGPYRLRLWIARLEGRPKVVGLEMWGTEPVLAPWIDRSHLATARDASEDPGLMQSVDRRLPDTPISAKTQRLPLGALFDRWVEGSQAMGRAVMDVGANREAVGTYLQQLDKPKKKGRPPLPADRLELVLKKYHEAAAAGDRAPAKAVERYWRQTFGPKDLKGSTVRSWIRRAKARGYPLAPERSGSESAG